MMLKKPMILISGHAVIEQVLIYRRVDVLTIGQIEREKPLLVEPAGVILAVRRFRMKILRRFTLNEYGVRTLLQNGVHGHYIRLAQIFQSGYKSTIRFQPFVPPAELR